MELLRQLVRAIPDFPKPGILYRDITPVLEDANGLREAVAALAQPFRDEKIDLVLGMESRGFIFGTAVALECCHAVQRREQEQDENRACTHELSQNDLGIRQWGC